MGDPEITHGTMDSRGHRTGRGMTIARNAAAERRAPVDAGQHGGYLLAVGLAALAGAVDAIGFVHWGGLFVSFMSGNSTIFAVKAAGAAWAEALLSATIIGTFVVGVATSEMFATSVGYYARTTVLLLEAALLGLGATASHLGGPELVTAPLLSIAMGVQNGAVRRAGGIDVSLTYVTGTLVNIGRGIGRAILKQGAWSKVLPFLGLWIGLVGGSAVGALVAVRSEPAALSGAAALALLAAAMVGLFAWDRAALEPAANGSAASVEE